MYDHEIFHLPLCASSLSFHRKRAKAKGQFSNLVRGAQKGASKGQKLKNKGKRQA